MNAKLSYSRRVRAFEKQGMSTSDAQGCADAQDVKWSELSRLRIENARLREALQQISDGDTMSRRNIEWTHGDTVHNYQRIASAALKGAE